MVPIFRVHHLAVDLDVHLIEMPFPLPNAPHPAYPLPADVTREQRPESVPPKPHRLVAQVNAALEQQIFHVPQRQRKTHVHQHHQADHLG